jgi:hypothetical protein
MACTSPGPASTVRAGGKVNERRNRAGSCLRQTTSTLSVRGYAIGRWPRFKSWQGGSRFFCFDPNFAALCGRNPLRLAAVIETPVGYVFTHDSTAVGEDGPTRQPIEHLASLRAIPGLITLRPRANAPKSTSPEMTKGCVNRPIADPYPLIHAA